MSPLKNTILTALDSVTDLPTLPSVISRLESKMKDDRTSADDIAAVISEDPTLTGKILKLVNSAYFAGRAGAISSIRNAVARLGLREVKRVCTIMAVIDTFQGFGKSLDHRLFWKHSLMTGHLAHHIHTLNKSAGVHDPDEIYVAGLLHDIGILIFDQYFPSPYSGVYGKMKETQRSLYELEMETFQLDHGEVGAHVLKKWNLPETIVQSVLYHHRIDACDESCKYIVATTNLADQICVNMGIGDQIEGSDGSFTRKTIEQYGFTSDQIDSIYQYVEEESKRCDLYL